MIVTQRKGNLAISRQIGSNSEIRLSLFKKKTLYLFYFWREGNRRREGKKHQCVVASHMAPTGDLAYNPGMCPAWELNWQPFGLQPMLTPLSYTSQAKIRLSISCQYLPYHRLNYLICLYVLVKLNR